MQIPAGVNGPVPVVHRHHLNPRRLVLATLAAAVAAACGNTSVTELTGPDAARCDISLATSSANVPASATQLNVSVNANRDCTWTAASSASWVQVAPRTGQGEAALTVNVAANNGQTARSGQVTVEGVVYQVFQAAPAVAPPPTPGCTYILDPPRRELGDRGGSREVRVNTGPSCQWTAASTVPWISISGHKSGTGSKTVSYRVDRNRSDDNRVGRIVIGGQVHTVEQEGD